MVAVCVVLVVVVIAVAGFIVHRQKTRNDADKKVEWKIPFSELDFAVKKSVSGSRKVRNYNGINCILVQLKYKSNKVGSSNY